MQSKKIKETWNLKELKEAEKLWYSILRHDVMALSTRSTQDNISSIKDSLDKYFQIISRINTELLGIS